MKKGRGRWWSDDYSEEMQKAKCKATLEGGEKKGGQKGTGGMVEILSCNEWWYDDDISIEMLME